MEGVLLPTTLSLKKFEIQLHKFEIGICIKTFENLNFVDYNVYSV